MRLVKGLGNEMEKDTYLQKPWGSDYTERTANFVKTRKVRQEILSLGYLCSIHALGPKTKGAAVL